MIHTDISRSLQWFNYPHFPQQGCYVLIKFPVALCFRSAETPNLSAAVTGVPLARWLVFLRVVRKMQQQSQWSHPKNTEWLLFTETLYATPDATTYFYCLAHCLQESSCNPIAFCCLLHQYLLVHFPYGAVTCAEQSAGGAVCSRAQPVSVLSVS